MVNNRMKYLKKFGNHKNIYNKYNILLFLLFILFSISKQNLNSNKMNKLIYNSEIVLTIRGTDQQQILYKQFSKKPSEILVNGDKIDIIDFYVYNLTFEENNITIKFNETLTNCDRMFYRLSNITKIAFNTFDFSGTSMKYMFSGCENLISLDLNHFFTSTVTDMKNMFKDCINLISLDLSKFDTSSVQYMDSMFSNCKNLKILDISHFSTSNVINMQSMFSD